MFNALDRSQRIALYLVLGLTAVSVGGGVAWSVLTRQPGPSLERARQALAEQRPADAIGILKEVSQQGRDSAELRGMLGRAYLAAGDATTAEKEFRAAETLGAEPGLFVLERGESLLHQSKLDEVLKTVRPVFRSPAQNARAHLLRGEALLNQAKADAAEAEYAAARDLAKTDANPIAGLAQVALLRQDFKTASERIDQALALDPKNIAALLARARLNIAQRKFSEALTVFDRAVATDPHNIDTRLELTKLLIEMNRLEDARAQINTALNMNPKNPIAIFLSAWIDTNSGQIEAAHTKLLALEKGMANFPPYLLVRGFVDLQRKDTEQAIYHLSRYIETQQGGDLVLARKTLAIAYMMNNNPARANDALQPIENTTLDPGVLHLIASAYRADGNLRRADDFEARAKAIEQALKGPTAQTAPQRQVITIRGLY